ncbi:MAG: glycosyltransferase family 4 protein [Pseudomonadota bacterium]|nr:glycosyltransferase family 4 protein [Pseudomonadota bacterium]
MLAWLTLFFIISAAGTWLARRYAVQRRLLDQPGERRSHTVATPRGGGISIVLALLVATVALALRYPVHLPLLAAFGIGLVIVAAVGWIDDHRPLSPWWRLAAHAVAGAVFGAAVLNVYGSLWLAVGAFSVILVLTNVWNFMDGIDGLAATQAVIVTSGLAWVMAGPAAALAWALVAACAGFLPFNFPRARIFLGDVGSGSLGYAIAGLLVIASARLDVSALLIFLPLAPFLVDAGLTLLRRMARRERWWTAHTQHAYQVWARRRHWPVTLSYGFASMLGLLGMLLAWNRNGIFIVCSVIAWYMSGAFLWLWLQRRRLIGSDRVEGCRG